MSTKPCSNCPDSCKIYPDACNECQDYKEQLLDALYYVDHLDEYYAGFEIIGNTPAAGGTITCPYCSAPISATAKFCEYCGMQVSDVSEKIQVNSAGEIPNPILTARDLIYERREIVKNYTKKGFLGFLRSTDTLDLGDLMTQAEIEKMANTYGVSVSSYLSGLDDGLYSSYSKYTNTVGSGTEYVPVVLSLGNTRPRRLPPRRDRQPAPAHNSAPRPQEPKPQQPRPQQNQHSSQPRPQQNQQPGFQQSAPRPNQGTRPSQQHPQQNAAHSFSGNARPSESGSAHNSMQNRPNGLNHSSADQHFQSGSSGQRPGGSFSPGGKQNGRSGGHGGPRR